jgi:hypothetical protein
MELEHAFQQSGFLVAFQLMLVGSLVAPAAMGETTLYFRLARSLASFVVTFGPMAILVYMLFKVSQLS